MDLDEQVAHVEGLLDRHTPAEAYGLFTQELEKEELLDQHTLAHVFGEVLYEKVGIGGFTVCDGSFGFGCAHSFVGKAITENGAEVVRVIDEQCIRHFGDYETGCFHGIGHGLLAYYGYGTNEVAQSLGLCAELSWKHPISGCSDGVFMEYNFRLMEADPNKRHRPFAAEDRYQPCAAINLYKEGCYFALPAWWATDSAARPEDVLGKYCSEVKHGALQTACFRGIGYALFPLVSFDASAGIAACDRVGNGGALRCREGLAWAFFADPASRDQAERICDDGLTEKEAAVCTSEYLFAIP